MNMRALECVLWQAFSAGCAKNTRHGVSAVDTVFVCRQQQ